MPATFTQEDFGCHSCKNSGKLKALGDDPEEDCGDCEYCMYCDKRIRELDSVESVIESSLEFRGVPSPSYFCDTDCLSKRAAELLKIEAVWLLLAALQVLTTREEFTTDPDISEHMETIAAELARVARRTN